MVLPDLQIHKQHAATLYTKKETKRCEQCTGQDWPNATDTHNLTVSIILESSFNCDSELLTSHDLIK